MGFITWTRDWAYGINFFIHCVQNCAKNVKFNHVMKLTKCIITLLYYYIYYFLQGFAHNLF